MDVLEFGSDWGLPHELKSWNLTDDVLIPGQCENGSKRRRLNRTDSVQEEAWLEWLDSSERDNQHDLLEGVKYETPKETDQKEELNDAEKSILNNLMRYLLDPPEAEDNPETGLLCGDSLGDHAYSGEGSVSGLELQLDHDIIQYVLEPQEMADEEITGISSSKISRENQYCIASSASSTELQIDDPKTPETRTEGRGMDEESEELSDADSDEITILDPENSVKKAKALTSAEENKWEELQISKSSHPASPSSSEETEILHCFSPQSEEEYNTVSLVHLLTACAEAATRGNRDLAAVILARIEHIVSSKQSTFQRIASYYYQSLQSVVNEEMPVENIAQSTETIAGAFQLLHEVCPYNKFAHMTANQAILETIEGKNAVHIIDFDIMEGLQWPPLMAALAARSEQVSFLKITAVELEQPVNTLSSSLELTGRRLSECAEALHIPFSFEIATLDEETGSLKLGNADDEGEILVANCMLKLPHMTPRNPKSITAFISAISKLQIKSVTLSDEAFKCRAADFTEIFFEILHHSCALFDSVEASLSMHNLAMAVVETTFLAPRIWSTVSSICQQEKDHKGEELVGSSRSSHIMQNLGFEPTNISHYNQTQAQLLLALYKEGYRIEDHEGYELAICWGNTPLVAVSTWKHGQSTHSV